MHRTYSVARLFGRWSLLVALALHFGMQSLGAQAPLPSLLSGPGAPSAPSTPSIELAVGTSRPWQMISRADLKRVENPNSRVVRVERMADRNNEILLVAGNPGRTQVTFIDQNDHVEVHDVIVTGAVQQEGEVKSLLIAKDTFVTETLLKVPLGGSEVTVGNIVEIIPAKNNPRQFSILGRTPGTTRLTFYGDAKKKEIVGDFDITVTGIDKVSQLRDMIRKIAPTAAVIVTPMEIENRGPGGAGKTGTAVLLTGTVTNIQDARMIEAAAKRLFMPSQIGTTSNINGANTQLQFNVINQIRVAGVHQIQLEVVVALVNRTEARNMSFSFAQSGTNWFLSSLFGAPLTFTNSMSGSGGAGFTSSLTQTGTANIPFGVINSKNGFMGFLQALRTESIAKILAEPRVVTLSGRPANILSGGEVPLLTSAGVGAPSISYKQFGTVVNALPIIMGDNKIYLEVKAEISSVDPTLGISIPGVTPTIVQGFRARSAQVAIQIEDGQTLAIGGLIQNDIQGSISRVPLLGDLPFLGVLFTQKQYTETEQELVILVTPRLVDPIDCTKLPKYFPGRETRSADDFEFFLEGIMEAPRGPRNVIFHPHYYRGAHTLSANAGQIPCGDGSYYNGGSGCANGNCGAGYSMLGGARMPATSMPAISMPTHTFPSLPASSNSRSNFDSELPPVAPPVRETQPPTFPDSPTPLPELSPRQIGNRPVLPPISPYNR